VTALAGLSGASGAGTDELYEVKQLGSYYFAEE
jgi:hypothetical protein